MPDKVRIALDAMGGDHGPEVVVPAPPSRTAGIATPNSSSLAIRRGSSRRLLLEPALKAVSRVVHTDVAIKMDDKPSQALRQGRLKSSMWQDDRCGEAGCRPTLPYPPAIPAR